MKSLIAPTVRRTILILPLLCFWLLLFLPSVSGQASRRSVPRLATRDYFVGKFVLLPNNVEPSSLQQPRLIAHVADHDLLLPPAHLLENGAPSEKLFAWLQTVNFAETDGLLLVLDALLNGAAPETVAQRLNALRALHQQHPRLPIFASLSVAATDAAVQQCSQRVLPLVEDGTLTHLLLNQPVSQTEPTAPSLRVRLWREVVARGIADRTALDEDSSAAPVTLVARMLAFRFGLSPQVLPVYSSERERTTPIGASTETLGQLVSAKLRSTGMRERAQAEVARGVETLLFIHTANTGDADRRAFASAIAQTLDKGVRVAVADVSESAPSKEALIAELRARNLLDKLASYASSSPTSPSALEAVNRALSHTLALHVAFRFLRDEYGRVYRIDRAHVRLLFSRYLNDWAYELRFRPAPRHSDDAANKSVVAPADITQLQTSVTEQLRPLAEELFQKHFRRNIHAILLNNGERARFEITLLQRLQVRISPQTGAAEINQAIHLAQLINLPAPGVEASAEWELLNEQLDDRLLERISNTDWRLFKTDVNLVQLNLKFAPVGPTNGYRIISNKRGSFTRRIEITAATPEAASHALTRLEQMGAEGELTRDAQITGAPTLAWRAVGDTVSSSVWTQRERLELLRFMGRVRLNAYFYRAPSSAQAEGLGEDERARLGEFLRAAEKNFVQLVYVLSPTKDDQQTDADAVALLARIRDLTTLGIRHFALDFSSSLVANLEINATAALHTKLSNTVSQQLQQMTGKPSLFVLPARPTASADLRTYLQELGKTLAPEIQLLLPGQLPATELIALSAARGNRTLLWADSLSNEEAWWRVSLAPFTGNAVVTNTQGLLINLPPIPWSAQLPLATAAEFAWQPQNYQPEQAFARVTQQLFDERSRNGLRAWRQAFGPEGSDPFQPLFVAQAGEINLPALSQKADALQNAVEAIALTPEHGLLRGELAQLLARLRRTLTAVPNHAVYEVLPNGNYRYRK